MLPPLSEGAARDPGRHPASFSNPRGRVACSLQKAGLRAPAVEHAGEPFWLHSYRYHFCGVCAWVQVIKTLRPMLASVAEIISTYLKTSIIHSEKIEKCPELRCVWAILILLVMVPTADLFASVLELQLCWNCAELWSATLFCMFAFTQGEPGELLLFAHCMFPENSKEDLFWFQSGEQLLCEASTVLKYVQEDSCQRGIYGKLVCTDFKIAFLSDDESVFDHDVCTSCTWLSFRGAVQFGPHCLFFPASQLLYPNTR